MDVIKLINVSKVYEVREKIFAEYGSQEYPSAVLFKFIFNLFNIGKLRRITALENVSLEIYKGEIFGLLGPNGSGKTTLMKIVSGVTYPTSGEVYVMGYKVGEEIHPYKFVNYIPGILAGVTWINAALSARTNLMLYAKLFGLPDKYVDEALKMAGLEEWKDVRVSAFSSGMVARLTIALALLRDTPIVLLDEPTAGLSPEAVKEFHKYIVEVLVKEKGATVIYATHNLSLAESIFDRVAILHKGRLLRVGAPREIAESVIGSSTIFIEAVAASPTDISKVREKITSDVSGIIYCRIKESNGVLSFRICCKDVKENLPNILECLMNVFDFKIRYVKIEEPTLEDAYIKLIEGGGK